jgi:hypothetical protein
MGMTNHGLTAISVPSWINLGWPLVESSIFFATGTTIKIGHGEKTLTNFYPIQFIFPIY